MSIKRSNVSTLCGAILFFLFSSLVDESLANRGRHPPRLEHERLFFDLTHPYDEKMPVRENGVPLELSPVQQDDGNGAR
jgi:hypothetical protein